MSKWAGPDNTDSLKTPYKAITKAKDPVLETDAHTHMFTIIE